MEKEKEEEASRKRREVERSEEATKKLRAERTEANKRMLDVARATEARRRANAPPGNRPSVPWVQKEQSRRCRGSEMQ